MDNSVVGAPLSPLEPPVYPREDVPPASAVGPTGGGKRKKLGYRMEKAALIAAVARALNRHAYPPVDRGAKSIVVSAVGDLLNGGYDYDLIEREAIAAALDWSEVRGFNKLLHLRFRVRAAQSEINKTERTQREAEWSHAPTDPAVLAAMRGMFAHLRSTPAPSRWDRTCTECKRTAVYGTTTCSDHGR